MGHRRGRYCEPGRLPIPGLYRALGASPPGRGPRLPAPQRKADHDREVVTLSRHVGDRGTAVMADGYGTAGPSNGRRQVDPVRVNGHLDRAGGADDGPDKAAR